MMYFNLFITLNISAESLYLASNRYKDEYKNRYEHKNTERNVYKFKNRVHNANIVHLHVHSEIKHFALQ